MIIDYFFIILPNGDIYRVKTISQSTEAETNIDNI